MTVTFDSVEIPNASKISEEFPTLTKETTLLSGKISVQSSTEHGYGATFKGFGTEAQADALLEKIGTKGSLIVNGATHGNCVIKGVPEKEESDNPAWFFITLNFVQDTVT